MSSHSSSLPISSILQTITAASYRRKHGGRDVVKQLAGMDPKRFLANLQAAATTRSSHALKVLAADMYELEDIFETLSRAGYDVSAAVQDFQVLTQFVNQCVESLSHRSHHHHSHSHSHPHHHTSGHTPKTTQYDKPIKKVHFATHATVYTLPPKVVTPTVFTPPSRPSCLPRVNRPSY